MSNIIIFPVIISFIYFSPVVIAQTNVSLFDFRIPESQYKKLVVGITGTSEGGSSMGSSNSTNRNRSYSGTSSIDNAVGYYSESSSVSYSLKIDGTLRKGFYVNNNTSMAPKENRGNDYAEGMNLNYAIQYSVYGISDMVFYYVGSNGIGAYGLNQRVYNEDGVETWNYYNKQRQYSASLGGGIGFGRIRNAQSVIVIFRILENLNNDSILVRELNENEIWDLVQVYESSLVYNVEHQRPSKYIVKVIFDVLKEKGLIRSETSASYSVSRTIEVFQEQIYPRLTGWIVQVGPSISGSEDQFWDSNNGKSLNKSFGNYVVISGNYGYPMSLNFHSTTTATLALPIYGNQNRVNYSLRSIIYYEIGERISASLGVLYYRSNRTQSSNKSTDSRYFSYYFSTIAEMNYFIEDNISLYIRGSYNDNSNRWESGISGYRSVSSGDRIEFGVAYKIL